MPREALPAGADPLNLARELVPDQVRAHRVRRALSRSALALAGDRKLRGRAARAVRPHLGRPLLYGAGHGPRPRGPIRPGCFSACTQCPDDALYFSPTVQIQSGTPVTIS